MRHLADAADLEVWLLVNVPDEGACSSWFTLFLGEADRLDGVLILIVNCVAVLVFWC